MDSERTPGSGAPSSDASERLHSYREKRDFARTTEPAPGAEQVEAGEQRRFVVQEHHARRLHWDLRLEHDGTLLSWAVPKGLPDRPDRNRLAVRTEDHPLEYLDFEGDIPAGEYGAGTMSVWDRGTYELHELRADKVVFTLHGRTGRAAGRHALIQTGEKNWLLHRMDPPLDPAAEALPEDFVPAWPVVDAMPDEPGWVCSPDLGGLRTLAYVEGGRARLVSFHDRGSEGVDVTGLFPEVQRLGRVLGSRAAILDGTLVAFDAAAHPDDERLLARIRAGSPSQVRRLADQVPAVFVVSDLPWLEGRALVDEPFEARRELLDSLGIEGANWQVAPILAQDRSGGSDAGSATACEGLLGAVSDQGLAGIDVRRLDAPYGSGTVEGAWRRVTRNTFDGGRVAGS